MSNNDIEVSVDLTKLDVSTNVDIEAKQNIITDIVLSSGGGTKDHNKLKNRDMENQHPITAITDLPAKLTELDTTDADLQDKISAETLRATTKEVELETSLTHLSDKIDTKQDKGDYALKSDIPNITNLATKTELQNGLDNKQDKGNYALKSEIPTNNNQLINGAGYITADYHDDTKQDVISDLNTIREGASKGSTALQPSDLATVATSGSYTDLINKPTIPSKTSDLTNDSGFITSVPVASSTVSGTVKVGTGLTITNGVLSADTQQLNVDSALSSTSTNPVQNKVINSALAKKQDTISDLEVIRNGASLGSTALQSYTETDPVYTADKPNIATKDELTQGLSIKQDVISDLESIRTGAELGSTALQSIPDEYVTETELNAKGYLTSYTEIDPIYMADKPNIALKSELPTKVSSLINDADYQTATDVASMIASIPQFEIKIVDVLPTEGQKMVLYLIPKASASGDNIYDEYIWLESTSSFELVGSTTVDLNDYYSKTETNELLNAKQDTISDLATIRSGASKGATALQSYTETDPIYTADKPYLALKSELPIIPTNVSEFHNDAGYITNTVNDLVNYTDTTALTDLLLNKQDTLINQENIKSVNNQSLLGSGNLDIDTLENVTYSELVELKTNGQLKKGLYYRITDYVTTTNGASASYKSEASRSAGHQFDIIVQALGTSDLAEICTACLHEGDTYFINDNLSGWQIWYDINNDTTKYAWADTTNGKGVIYRLIDEKGNECPYDFKNIQFYRNPSNYADIKTLLTVSDGYYYTFSHYTSSTMVEDWTLGTAGTKFNFENKLGECSDRQSDNDTTKIKKLNNSLFILTQSASRMTRNNWGVTAYNNTMVTTDMFNNSVLYNFTNNISNSQFRLNNMGATVNGNKFLAEFGENFISGSFNNNTIKAQTIENTFYIFFYNNTINAQFGENFVSSACQSNTFGGAFLYNITSPFFKNNTISNYSYYNQFGARFRDNTLKSSSYNVFGSSVSYCTFGDMFKYNNVSSNVYYCTFGDYNTNNTVEPSTSYIKTASGTSTTNLGLSNSTIKAGVIGSSSTNLLDLTALPTNTSYSITIQKDVNGKVLATWNDSGATKGKYKESITATTWNDIVPDYYTTTEIDTKIGDISSLLDSINGEV